MTAREVMALVTAYGQAVRRNVPPDEMRTGRDRVIKALAAANIGQRYASRLEEYARANRRQVNRELTPEQRTAAGHQAEDIAADIERAVCTALGEEPPPPRPPAPAARTGRTRPAHGRG